MSQAPSSKHNLQDTGCKALIFILPMMIWTFHSEVIKSSLGPALKSITASIQLRGSLEQKIFGELESELIIENRMLKLRAKNMCFAILRKRKEKPLTGF